MTYIKQITSIEVQTPVDFYPGKEFFDRITDMADYCNVYELASYHSTQTGHFLSS